jgi:DNA-binding transcriptional MerR regulator
VLRISEFSRLSQVTVKALHLYDRLGLLEPARVDSSTGYRLYTLDQLPRLNRILALKDLGFSLGEIRGLLDEDVSPGELRGMLRLKRAELERQVAEGRERLARVEARLRQIEREGAPPAYDVAVKSVEPMAVASARALQPTHGDFIRFSYEVPALVRRSGIRSTGPTLAIFHNEDEGFLERDFDVEVAVPVPSGTRLDIPASGGGRVRVRELERLPRVAYTVWRGVDPLIEAYAAIGSWIADNGYRVPGPSRELYLRGAETGDPVFEIQYPVEER